ncbi:hypothetical protein Nepgr_033290 [Nepenthes gracilis]|uniref:Protein NBR1 homolog n=1 Tax=Nepenthes gracilis TaxID=150966 RepID=A0AAD3TL50_NEPGR|nr:hypothetical protein Nepgr_033290 [Nepenthes gracilis]
MASSIVMKVKYGENLRRFNVLVVGDHLLDLDMEGLKEKIRSLFDFTSDVVFTLTYVDEDLDTVTLADDEDLHDVLRQGLNPVRITVQLNADKGSSSYVRPGGRFSGSSTPIQSSEIRDAQTNTDNGVAEVLKSVPEPLREAFLKLYLDVASKAASSSPILSELLDGFMKMGKPYLSTPHTQSENPKEPSAGKNPEASKHEGVESVNNSSEGQVVGNIAKFVADLVTSVGSVDLNILPSGSVPQKNTNVTCEATCSNLPPGDDKKAKDINDDSAGKSSGCFYPPKLAEKLSPSDPPTVEAAQGKSKDFASGFGSSSSSSSFVFNPRKECPFSGIPSVEPLPPGTSIRRHWSPVHHPLGAIFHRGVRCDGCGVFPITGPRFKSKVKENYDLCSICFGQMGNDGDYTRMDFPAPSRHPWSCRGFYDPMIPQVWAPPPHVPSFSRHGGKKKTFKTTSDEESPARKADGQRLRLDSCFIADVNVMDGTIMAPKTPFTKIWLMRNNGRDIWPCGTQLLWIGGDRFSESDSVEIKIPAEGLHVDSELHVAVDFTAPEMPGQYISYWRMASPSGQKFGQRVWVLIQVDASLMNLTWDTTLNLNLPPPVCTGSKDATAGDGKILPLVDITTNNPGNPVAVKESEKPLVDEPQPVVGDLNLPSDWLHAPSSPEALPPVVAVAHPVGSSNPQNPSLQGATSSVSYPLVDIDFSAHAPALAYPTVSFPFPIVDMSEESIASSHCIANVKGSSEEDGEKEKDVERTLLKELEEMGFRQVDLNKEILRMNGFNLEQSVDHLCSFAEWDPILEELQEMGFHDREMNKQLLVKNNGSLKHVVMDLIARE